MAASNTALAPHRAQRTPPGNDDWAMSGARSGCDTLARSSPVLDAGAQGGDPLARPGTAAVSPGVAGLSVGLSVVGVVSVDSVVRDVCVVRVVSVRSVRSVDSVVSDVSDDEGFRPPGERSGSSVVDG